jgi:SAM-dependent methyltransferase
VTAVAGPPSDLPGAAGAPCRLCGGATRLRFTLALAHGLTGRYFECQACRFLRSDHLDDGGALATVYRRARADDDEGAAWRQFCIASRLTTLAASRALPHRPLRVLDFGCATGFLPAYLRVRHGWDAHGYEAYGQATFLPSRVHASWAEVAALAPFDLLVATEVLEHLPDPLLELRRMASVLAPGACVYVTTSAYDPAAHDARWHYLAPHTAQHCAFYSRPALAIVARALGAGGPLQVGSSAEWLFARPGAPRAARLVAWGLRRAVALKRLPAFE